MKNADMIIRNGIVLTQDPEDRILYGGAVAVRGGVIEAVGDCAEIEREYRAEEVVDASGKAVLPGFVNTHFHFTQSFMKGTRDDLDLLDWIDQVSFPKVKVSIDGYRRGSSEIHRLAAMHAGIDLLSSGVTCTTNMEWGMRPEIAEAYDRLGSRIINILTLTDVDSWTPKEAIIEEEEVFLLAAELIEAFRKPGSRTEFAYGIACPNSATEKMVQRAAEEAARKGTHLHIHLAETKYEYDRFLKEKGATPTKYLDDLGFWNHDDVSAAHSIWLDDGDVDILAGRGVGVAHNPKCNMKIADGAAPVAAMLKKGVEVGLGIDSCAVSDNTDFFEAMRTMVFLQRLTTMDPKAVLGREALRIATIGGAKVLGKEKEIGSIEEGKCADLLLVDLTAVNTRPYNEIVNNLVFAANSSNIERVIVGGETLVNRGEFTRFDKEAVLDDAERQAARIYREAGIEIPAHFMIKDLQGGC
jgi:5-methylthioadenosine/S-adenosylhomocysteine deaminase